MARCCFVLLLGMMLGWLPAATAAGQAQVQLLTSALLGRAVLAGSSVVFVENTHLNQLVAYDSAFGTRTLVTQSSQILALAADGSRVTWAEAQAQGSRVFIHDLRTLVTSQVAQSDSLIAGLALDGDTLYLADQRGLVARNLTTNTEDVISTTGRRPVASAGALLWSEARDHGERMRSEWRLMLRESNGQTDELARSRAGYGGFLGYALTPAAAIWAFVAPADETRLIAYDRASGNSAPLADDMVDSFAAAGNHHAWIRLSAEGQQTLIVDGALESSEQILGLQHAQVEAVLPAAVIVSLEGDGARRLYLLPNGAVMPTMTPSTRTTTSAGCTALPASCGQVALNNNIMVDNGGRWTMRGVQMFLPRYGINSKTMNDGNYNQAVADGSLDYWLDRARDALRVNMLRLFVDMPYQQKDQIITPTSYNTLYDIARRAEQRGMRLGLSVHNNADWDMTEARIEWLGGLLDYFAARGALPLIAYINADNEINNHCGNGDDCFDRRGSTDPQPYINGAIGWVAALRAVVKAHGPVLVTVGISSEVRDYDGTPAALDYFRRDSSGRRLADQVDFLSPHNYSGGADGVIDDLRRGGYAGVIVLEEFGYPTDPFPRDNYWTEGGPQCRLRPFDASCRNTAPFFLETNLRALVTRSYAGSSAWMLTDVDEKNGTSGCSRLPSDLWTGLLAAGGQYCDGGTATRTLGQPKATAVRVCIAYGGSIFECDPQLVERTRLYLPQIAVR